MHNDLHALRRILKSCTTIAVVGLSAEWHRPSYFAAKYMQSHGQSALCRRRDPR
jgi:predicted CoA-binding protein